MMPFQLPFKSYNAETNVGENTEVKALIFLLCFRFGLIYKMKGVENTDLNETS